MIPFAFSRPAGFRVAPTDEAMPFRMCSGFQSISATFLIARAPNLGIAIVIKTERRVGRSFASWSGSDAVCDP